VRGQTASRHEAKQYRALENRMNTLQEIFEKYEEAEGMSPAWERTILFSWDDMLALKAEIERLQRQLFDCRQEIFKIVLGQQDE
jgi:DNA repair ATPase RecN